MLLSFFKTRSLEQKLSNLFWGHFISIDLNLFLNSKKIIFLVRSARTQTQRRLTSSWWWPHSPPSPSPPGPPSSPAMKVGRTSTPSTIVSSLSLPLVSHHRGYLHHQEHISINHRNQTSLIYCYIASLHCYFTLWLPPLLLQLTSLRTE